MDHPLDGARLKVVWAQKHLDTLKAEIGKYLDTHPYEIPTERKGDVVAAQTAIITLEPSHELGCIVADCLENARKALDYIAWALASKFSAKQPLMPGKDRITFPIFDNPTDFRTKSPSCLMPTKYNIPAGAIAIVEGVQPYNAGHESLRLLSGIVNTEKHCVPLMTIAHPDTASMMVVTDSTVSQRDITVPGLFEVSGFSEPGEEGFTGFQRITDEEFRDPNRDPFAFIKAAQKAAAPGGAEQKPGNVKVDAQVTVFVSIKDPLVPPEPVDLALEQIIKCVSNIVPLFEPFFV